MKVKLLSISIISIFIVLISSNLFAQLQSDLKFGFSIDVPSNWSKNSYMDGTDKVFDYMSADENAAVQLRVFDASADITTSILAQVYEESMLPAGAQKISLNEQTTNGIPCQEGAYLLDYNGNDIRLSALYIVQNNKGYVLTALIPSSMLRQKGAELQQIVQSFSIDGFKALTAKQDKKPSGLGGLMGSTTNVQKPSANINSGNAKQFEIKGHYAYDFKLAKVISYAASTGEGFVLSSGCDGLPELSGKFIITNYNSFKNSTSWDRGALSRAARHDRQRVPFNKVCVCELRDGSYAKFMLISEQQNPGNRGCSRTVIFQVE
jgi:hypothetical protein